MKKFKMRHLMLTAALCSVVATSPAMVLDATIKIDRALNSPTIVVRYSGASAAIAEMRLNGQSIATRQLDSKSTHGETNFNLETGLLRDGDNNLEIRLFDASGRLVGTEKNVISTDDGVPSPFYIEAPKMGQNLQGPVEIKLGFGQSFTSKTVSFFIDNRFVLMTNTPPFTYTWDTLAEKNGWHELESWLVDDNSTTFKTRKVRVFINNPAGNTNRHNFNIHKPVDLTAKTNSTTVQATYSEAKLHDLGGSVDREASQPNTALAPVGITELLLNEIMNITSVELAGKASMIKPPVHQSGVASGAKILAVTGSRVAVAAATTVRPVSTMVRKPSTGTAVIKVAPAEKATKPATRFFVYKGFRMEGLSTFSVLVNNKLVNFDVQPRVDEGVPMTPLRYLLEKDGGKVNWDNHAKTVFATAEGHNLTIKIGDSMAHVDRLPVEMERTPYLLANRTIVPLSFIQDALKVNVEYDKATGHVLISSAAH